MNTFELSALSEKFFRCSFAFSGDEESICRIAPSDISEASVGVEGKISVKSIISQPISFFRQRSRKSQNSVGYFSPPSPEDIAIPQKPASFASDIASSIIFSRVASLNKNSPSVLSFIPKSVIFLSPFAISRFFSGL